MYIKNNNINLQKKSPYLEIYKNKTILFIICSSLFDKKYSFNDFLKYKEYLESEKINVIVENNISEIFNIDNIKTKYPNLANIFILDKENGIKNDNGEYLSFLGKIKVKQIIEKTHNKISMSGENYEKIKKIYELQNMGFNKITLTTPHGIKEEIEKFGSGTMFVNLKNAKFKNIENFELFEEIYKYQYKLKNWKKRNKNELKKLFKNYKVFDLEGTILGGYALTDFEIKINGKNIKAKLLENLFSLKNGGGIGYILGEEIQKEKIVFAYTKVGRFFEKLGFTKIEGKKSETGANLWMYEKSK